MNWEALTALSTAFTGLVILFTVLVGWHQLRIAAKQSLQAHRATQLDGMMRIFAQFDDPKFVAARRYINDELRYGFPIIRITSCLQPLIERHRVLTDNPYLWKDTEALGQETQRWGVAFMMRERRLRPSTGEVYSIDSFDAPATGRK